MIRHGKWCCEIRLFDLSGSLVETIEPSTRADRFRQIRTSEKRLASGELSKMEVVEARGGDVRITTTPAEALRA